MTKMVAGDVLVQLYEGEIFNYTRLLAFAAFGAAYVGYFQARQYP
jgi:hypothetical protein